ncbi:MAG TPA: hypothetical protein VES89_08145 [Candidatus Competibacteraceae bacterium]|nr:hypothetical protein [Candidatus Competibacteraceae bacterium]
MEIRQILECRLLVEGRTGAQGDGRMQAGGGDEIAVVQHAKIQRHEPHPVITKPQSVCSRANFNYESGSFGPLGPDLFETHKSRFGRAGTDRTENGMRPYNRYERSTVWGFLPEGPQTAGRLPGSDGNSKVRAREQMRRPIVSQRCQRLTDVPLSIVFWFTRVYEATNNQF